MHDGMSIDTRIITDQLSIADWCFWTHVALHEHLRFACIGEVYVEADLSCLA